MGLGSFLGGLAGYALAPFTGGASLVMAGLGAAAGTKLEGGSTSDALKAGLLTAGGAYLGGEFLGAAGGGGGAGAGAMGPMTAGELGAGFEGYMGGLGYAPSAYAANMMGPMGAAELGAGFQGYMGAGGIGSTALPPVVDAVGVPGLNPGPSDISFPDALRRRMAMMGTGGMGGAGSLMQLGSGLYGLSAMSSMRAAAQDPNAPYRAGYAADMNALMMNPNQVQNLPGYRAGLQAVQRAQLAQGFQGSGNMMAALSKYGAGAYNDRLAQLERLSGSAAGPGAYLNAQAMANMGTMSSLGLLAGGLRGFGY